MDENQKVGFLERPDSYPERTAAVETIETHMSWVFITDRFVYKLKKPVRYPFLDFRTVDARHQDCLEELRLNRRLARGIYLGIVPLTQETTGQPELAGRGSVVDWLVHMRRLPHDRMLERMIEEDTLRTGHIAAIGERLAHFYSNLPPIEITPDEYMGVMRDDIDENLEQLSDPSFGLPLQRVKRLCSRQLKYLDQCRSQFTRRVESGLIIEGHGDLRPEHVCLTSSPVIIDCLEFKRAFRLLDPIDELAFLALECERLGAGWVQTDLLSAYKAVTQDDPPDTLIHFFASFRAALRAKISVWHNRDDSVRNPEKWVRRALTYLELGERHADQFNAIVTDRTACS